MVQPYNGTLGSHETEHRSFFITNIEPLPKDTLRSGGGKDG